MLGREEVDGAPVGPAFVGLGVAEAPDATHAARWVRPLKTFALRPSDGVHQVPHEGAYDIVVWWGEGEDRRCVLFDNLTAFVPKDTLLRGQSIPGGSSRTGSPGRSGGPPSAGANRCPDGHG